MHLNDARKLVLAQCRSPQSEDVSMDSALGRVLARPVHAAWDVPSEPRSRLDGYAVRSEDLTGAGPDKPASLTMLPQMLPAGHSVACAVRSGECMRIMTGARLPEGADAVLAQETVSIESGLLKAPRPCRPADGVVLPGSDTRVGERVLCAGDVLTPTRLALLAALGLERVPVARRPRAALLSTGDEVRELGVVLGGPFTHCNTRYLLAWSIAQQGGEVVHLGAVNDDPDALAAKLAEVDADLVISTGGMGQGDRDFVMNVWHRLGINVLFSELNLSPGRRSASGSRDGQLFWGLPGSPWAAQVVFAELVAPVIRAMQRVGPCEPFSWAARLTGPLRNRTRGFKTVRGTLDVQGEVACFSPETNRKESLFAGLRNDLAYVLLGSDQREMVEGETIRVRLLDFPLAASPLFGALT